MTWSNFNKNHQHVIAACDFFTTEVITPFGLITYYVLFFILTMKTIPFGDGQRPMALPFGRLNANTLG